MKTDIREKGIRKMIAAADDNKLIKIQDIFDADDEIDSFVGIFEPIKINLPDSESNFDSGNGEGIWVQALNSNDQIIYDSEIAGETFYCFLMNNSIYYPPLQWGTVIKCKNISDKDKRPILDRDWISSVIYMQSNGKIKLEDTFDTK